MKVSLITFADLGAKENLKTPDILPVIEELARRNQLVQIICRVNRGFSLAPTWGAVPILWHYVLGVVRRIPLHTLDMRLVQESIFDNRAKRIIQDSDVAVFHFDYFAPKTMKEARRRGARIVGIAATAHPAYNARLEKEEGARLGVTNTNNLHYHKRVARLDGGATPDYLIVHSDFVRATYIQEGFPPDRILVAPLDIDAERFAPSNSADDKEFMVLYVGQSTILKGLEYLFAAWKSMLIRDEARLVVAGGYSDMPTSLRRRYNAIVKNNPSIRWIRFAKRPQELYQQASVLVLPSLSEGFGRVTLEAMACGIPVITTEHAQGIVEDGVSGFIVPIRDSAAIADKIEYLYKNPAARKRMGDAAREAVIRKERFALRVADYIGAV